jgi:hypothetical protein
MQHTPGEQGLIKVTSRLAAFKGFITERSGRRRTFVLVEEGRSGGTTNEKNEAENEEEAKEEETERTGCTRYHMIFIALSLSFPGSQCSALGVFHKKVNRFTR